MTVQPQKRD